MTSAVRHAAPQQSASGSKPWSQPISAPSHASASEMSMPPMSIRQGRFDQMTVAPQPGQLKAFRNKPRHLKLCTTSVRRKLHPQLGHNFAKMLIRYLSANDFALALRAAESGTPTSRKPESPAAMGWAILSVSSDRIDPSAAVVDIGLDRTRWWRCFRLRSFIDMRTARYEQRQCGKYEGSCVHPFHTIW